MSENEKNQQPLDNLKEGSSTTFDVSQDAQEAVRRFEAEQEARKHEQMAQTELGDEVTLKVEIKDALTPLSVVVTYEVAIGRRDPATQEAPELDLTPYGGYQLGISRRHAIIRLQNKKLEIYDLGSRNGTYLNGKRLLPLQPHTLHTGAVIRLGKVEMRIHIVG